MIYYLDMDRKIIRITENELKKIIRKSVNEALNMASDLDDDIDITKIPIDILRRGYFDYRLVPVSSYYGSPISSPTSIKEAIGDIMSPDIVSNSEIGIYTEQPISNDRIEIEEVVQLKRPQKWLK